MGDLISRKALLEEVDNFSLGIGASANAMALVVMGETKKSIAKMIENQPTAFDLESVIEKLKENEHYMLKAIEENYPSEWHMIKIMDLKALFEDYTKEQIEILNSAANATNRKIGG